MQKHISTVASLTLLATFSLVTHAQNTNAITPYLGVEFGSIQFKDQTSVASGLVSAVGGTATSTQDTGMTVGRFFGGVNLTENIGAELGYIYSGTANATFSGVSRSAVAYSGSATQKADGVDYSALIRPNVSTGLNGLFLRVGGHSLNIKTDVSLVTGTTSGASSSNTSGTGALFGIGYDGKINEKLDFRVSYTSYNSVAGKSGNDINLISFGLISKF